MSNMGESRVVVVKSPKSNESLWGLSNFETQFEQARQRSLEATRGLVQPIDVAPIAP